jgi:hypothetical protein
MHERLTKTYDTTYASTGLMIKINRRTSLRLRGNETVQILPDDCVRVGSVTPFGGGIVVSWAPPAVESAGTVLMYPPWTAAAINADWCCDINCTSVSCFRIDRDIR